MILRARGAVKALYYGAGFGVGVTILRATQIGEGCVIGAGCVVQGETPPHSLVTASRALTIVPIEDRPQLE